MSSSEGQQTTSTRKLAAIMFSDIVGYTKLMGEDEDKAFDVLKKNRELHTTLLDKYNGTMLKELGDGILASFSSVSDAVYCALDIQRQAVPDPDFDLRVGINLGEVVFEGSDVHGDGVNIASRLTDVAKSGHVLVSEAVYKNISNKKGIQTQFIDRMTLKNVAEPVGIYLINPSSGDVLKEIDGDVDKSFWDELNHRNVFRAFLSYIILFLLLIEIGRTIFQALNLPQWSLQVLLGTLIAGLPVSVILAWFYERSPEGFVRTSSRKSQENPYTSPQRKPLTTNTSIGVILLITIIIYVYPRFISSEPPLDKEVTIKRFNINFPEDAPVALVGSAPGQWAYPSISLSPDGKSLVYVAAKYGSTQLHLRYIDNVGVIPLENTEGSYSPIFSPDGKWIAFGKSETIMKVAVPDGIPMEMARTGDFRDILWLSNDEIIYSNNTHFFMIPAQGGNPTLLSTRDTTANLLLSYASGTDLTPSSKHLLYNDFRGDIYSVSLETLKHNLIYPNGGGSPRYLASGHLAFSRSNKLFVVPYDIKRMRIMGNENQVLTNIRTERSGPQLTISNDGMAIHIEGSYYQRSVFSWTDGEGNIAPIDIQPDSYGSFDLSPDGRYLAAGMLPAMDHVKVFDFETGRVIPIRVKGAELVYSPTWGPDSRSLLFGASIEGKWIMYEKGINDVGDPQPVSMDEIIAADNWPYSWSESGDYYTIQHSIFRLANNELHGKLIHKIPGGHHAEVSPDGKFVVYVSSESGEEEIYLQPFPASGEKWQLSIGGGTDPVWTPDGEAIFYHDNKKILRININSSDGLSFETPKIFYDGAITNAVSRSLATSPDGKRVMFLQPVSGTQLAHEAIVTMNWFEEVKRLAPVEDGSR